MTIICSGMCAVKDTDPKNPIFRGLEDNSVVFENGRYFQFTGKTRNNSPVMTELPPIKNKQLLLKIFSDIDNTLGCDGAGVIENCYGELIWEY